MRNPKTYIPCVLLTVIFVFTLLGSGICIIADKVILNPQTCIKIVDEKQLDSKVKVLIDKNFREKYNATGIPAEVYTDIITQEWINENIKLNIVSGFEYVNGNYEKFSISPDFEALDKNISEFFSSYAEKNGYVKDSSYTDKLNTEIKNAHSVITGYTDVFKMNTLYSQGVLIQARRYIGYLDKITYLCIGGAVLSFVLLLVLSLKRIRDLIYWTGCTAVISSIIGLIPCIYITSSNYFDSFVIKQEQIFIAFTSFMYKIVDTFTVFGFSLLAIGGVMLIAYCALNGKESDATD